ncbi:hypothetical protein P2318_06850 [Myxococcaceae bacterium GXIMD 01537]
MTSIRRLLPGISSALTRATSLEVTAPARKETAPPVEPVHRGFSDQSDFQPDIQGEVDSQVSIHAPLLAERPGEPLPEPLRGFTGASDFQARAPRYGYLLGTNVPPPGLGAASRGAAPPGVRASSLHAEHAARPALSGASLEQAQAHAGADDEVLLYPGTESLPEHAVVRHWDGHVTDPLAPTVRYPDSTAWERAHAGHASPTVLKKEDVDLVLGTAEGPERDALLAYFAPDAGAVDSFEPVAASTGGDAGFFADLSDLPTPPAPEDLLSLLDAGSGASDFLVDAADVQPLLAREPSTVEAEDVPTPDVGASALDARGTPAQQVEEASALYARSQTSEVADATEYQRAAALAASGSPEATQALLSQVGEPNLPAFVSTLLGVGHTEPAAQ